MAELQLRRLTQEAFFAWQEKQDKLYELVDGLPVLPLKMMTGASRAHDRVVTNLIRHLGNKLAGGPCWPMTDDLAVRIPSGNIRRPDVTVECGGGEPRDVAVRDPRVVIEVLSPSTMNFDRVRKLPEYQTIPTVMHILLVDTEAPKIGLWSRAHDGAWVNTNHDDLEATVDLSAIGVSLSSREVYEGLSFES